MKKHNLLINEMLASCVHLGHKKNLLNKDMEEFTINTKSELSIINLEKTLSLFIQALKVIKKTIELNKIILFICTKPQLKKIIKISSKSINMPYINGRWLNGTLTNFKSIKSSINKMNYLIFNLKKRKIQKLKSKEINIYIKKIKIMKRKYRGIKNIKKLPDLLFIIDSKKHKNSIIEAKKMNIPVISVVDTNSSTKNIDYVIPGNDDSFKSIIFYMKYVTKTVNETKNKFNKN